MSTIVLDDPKLSDRDVLDSAADALGLDAAIQARRDQLAAIREEFGRVGAIPHGEALGRTAGWIHRARDLAGDIERLESGIAYLEARASGDDEPPEPKIDPGRRDRAVIRALVMEPSPDPGFVRKALGLLNFQIPRNERDLARIEAELANHGRAFKAGSFTTSVTATVFDENTRWFKDEAVETVHQSDLTPAKFDELSRRLLPQKNRLARLLKARQAAVDAIKAHLAGHAKGAVDGAAVASGLHARALLQSPALSQDPRLKSLTTALDLATAEVNALSLGGKILAGIKGDIVMTRKRDLEKAVKARRDELLRQLGEPSADMTARAAAGDFEALEYVAFEAIEDPDCFPEGTLARILGLQADALCQAATVVLDLYRHEAE